jgi:hypothetical protein
MARADCGWHAAGHACSPWFLKVRLAMRLPTRASRNRRRIPSAAFWLSPALPATVYDSGQHGATAALRRRPRSPRCSASQRRMTSGEAPGTPALPLHLSSLSPSTLEPSRTPALAPSTVLWRSPPRRECSSVVTAHLRYAAGHQRGLSVLAFKQCHCSCTQGLSR